ncbi:MAG: hypothetical protein HQL67_06260 [Magnetococcales bacterium]|nr:hypothetical protein [Magnetococcales bacterium]
MKISIGMKLQTGPWGGGNQFGTALSEALAAAGHSVYYDLKDPDLDLILLTEPRLRLTISGYNHANILRYLLHKNRRALVVHRVNECDERKEASQGVNDVLASATRVADHTVFVSHWLRDLHLGHGMPVQGSSVIHNGGNRAVFNSNGYEKWDGLSKIRMVTHHWGNNWLKGFDIYQRLDQLLAQSPYKDRFEFTYIGQIPEGFTFTNSRLVDPLSGPELANEIRRHHLYLTASRNEPGSNHNIEGALCGLPLLYLDSASMAETSRDWGLAFDVDNFEEKLWQMVDLYPRLVEKMADYPFDSKSTCGQYVTLFENLLTNREEILQKRNFIKQPIWLAKNWWQGRIAKPAGRYWLVD